MVKVDRFTEGLGVIFRNPFRVVETRMVLEPRTRRKHSLVVFCCPRFQEREDTVACSAGVALEVRAVLGLDELQKVPLAAR